MVTSIPAQKEFLRELGQKVYDWLKEEKIVLKAQGDVKSFESELERIRTLIDYVMRK